MVMVSPRTEPASSRARPRGTTTRIDVAIELHPLEQFTIERIIPIHIGGLDVSYTNAALMMTIAVIFVTALMVLTTRRAALVPGRWQSVAEMLYEFVADMVDSNIGQGGRQFFPFVFTLFTFILFANLLGMIPFSYTTTSQIIVTFALAAVVFILVTAIGIIRPFTLSIRLFANMLAGHTMLAIFGGFAASIGVFALFPTGINVLLVGLEFLVAVLQAYVFAILTCLYLNEAVHLH